MSDKPVTIESVAYELPPHRITSAWLENQISGLLNRLRITPGQILALTGIRERRFWDPHVTPSQAATMAARKAIEKAGIAYRDIGVLVSTSVCKDYIEPSVACLVHHNLQLSPHCLNFDIGNACLAFINAITIVGMMIEKGQVEYGLIVDGESSRQVVESTIQILNSPESTMQSLSDHFATLTLGSGAAAMVLSHRNRSRTNHVIQQSVSLAATEHAHLCRGQRDQMITNASSVMVNGVKLAHDTWMLASKQIRNWSDATIDHYIPHQVSQRNMDVLNRKLGLTPEKHCLTFPYLGNIGPAAVPISLAIAEEEGRFKPGDHLALMGIGSGLNCTMMSIIW
ncbi:MAG: 3-oxoacyl-ACP synthase III [Thermodesulfobacteriota bacterium]